MVDLESVILTIFIYAYKEHYLTVKNVLKPFLITENNKLVIIKVTNKLLEEFLECTLDVYSPFIFTEANSKKALYLKLNKALYRCLYSTMIF